jgi:hypothetical protein
MQGCRKSESKRCWDIVMATLVLCLCWLGMGIAADPDFSTITDILNGRRHLLRTDDVVWTLTFTTPPSGGFVKVPVVTAIASTQNSGFPGGGVLEPLESTDVNTNTDNIGNSTATAVGRIFNLPYDVVAMVGTLAGGEASPPQLFLTVIDPPTQSGLPSVSLPLPISQAGFDSRLVPNLTFTLMADFTGDGYADLVIASTDDFGNSGMVILTAVDVNNVSAGLRPGPILTFSGGAEISSVTLGDFRRRSVGDCGADGGYWADRGVLGGGPHDVTDCAYGDADAAQWCGRADRRACGWPLQGQDT